MRRSFQMRRTKNSPASFQPWGTMRLYMQSGDVAARAFDAGETRRARGARRRVADREHPHVPLLVAAGEGANAVRAGREQSLRVPQIEWGAVGVDDPQHWLDQH